MLAALTQRQAGTVEGRRIKGGIESKISVLQNLCFSGRTGRAGHAGKAVTFFTEDDKPLLRR